MATKKEVKKAIKDAGDSIPVKDAEWIIVGRIYSREMAMEKIRETEVAIEKAIEVVNKLRWEARNGIL